MAGDRAPVVHPFEKLSNFRDVGGLRTGDGGVLKTGVLFRSEELSRLTERDAATLREFGIRSICDLRSPEESRKKAARLADGTAIRVVNIPLHDPDQESSRTRLLGFLFGKTGGDRYREFGKSYYHHLAFERTSRMREILTMLSKEENLPALIHCSAGRDRTGFVAAVIQLFAGVPYETVMEEYLRTNDYFGPRLDRFVAALRVMTLFLVPAERVRSIAMAQPEFLHEVYERILQNYGSVEGYLGEGCAIERDTLEELKRRLLGSG
jgi:protein-tyrosine phosphatase